LKSFDELVLDPKLKQALKDLQFDIPTPIQAQAIPLLLGEPTDFIGLAATGTGKTAAFGIPLLQNIDVAKKVVQGLILCPTRELALQVAGQINLLGKHKGIKTVAIYGGSSFSDQVRGIRDGAHVVIGTPGRLVDHITRGTLKFDGIQTVILDEADEMISMGFKEDLETILKGTSGPGSHIWFFTATMDRDVRRVADTFLREPRHVQVNRTEMLSNTVEQIFYATREGNKPEILCKIIDAAEDFYGLVFCQTKQLVTTLTQYLIEKGYKVDCLHGDKDQSSRERTMQAFRDKRVKMLICTDVASRGLDVKDLTHVINYSIPRELESYVHRIGRTARSGKSGIAISLVTPSHRNLIGRIEQMTKSKIKEGILPTRKEVGAKKVNVILPQFKEIKNYSRAIELMGQEWRDMISKMTRDEIAGRFLMLTFPDIFNEKEPTSLPSLAPVERERQPHRKGGHQGRGGRSPWEKTNPNRGRPASKSRSSRY
jgi:ATP-dependent RNA helicase DeaD